MNFVGLLFNKWSWVLIVILGLTTALWLKNIQVKSLKADVAKLSVQVEALHAANEESTKTINELKAEALRIVASYEARLKLKEKAVQDAIRVCGLKPIKPIQGGNHAPGTDPVLDELNQLFPAGN